MKRSKSSLKKVFIWLFVFTMLFSNFSVFAEEQADTFTTYTFDSEGNAVNSPEAYKFIAEYDGRAMGTDGLKNPSDLFVDKQNNIYITDKGNNRIIILNNDFTLKTVIKEFTAANADGAEAVTDTFNAPSSVYVTNAGHMYVADTDNNRIVEFDENNSFVRQIGCPDSKILGDNYVFSPTSIAVDSSSRIYVMIKNENQGIVELNPDGTFIGYYGAQKVQQTLFDWFKTLFMTKEQKSRIAKTIPRTYNSMVIDDKDFVWLTSNSLTVYQRKNYMTSKSSANASVKRLNPSGSDVLTRQGKYAPGGDLLEVSSLVDVAVKDNGVYSLLDNLRNRIFTYDSHGNLLYAFGGAGTQNGCMTLAAAVAYLGDDIIALDSADGTVVLYGMTDYAAAIQNALVSDDEKDFEKSMEYWNTVLDRNQNFELAYKAMGNNYLRNGYYREAMKYYKNADEKDGYSKAFQYIRTDFVKHNFFLVIGIAVIVIVLLLFYKKWVNRENKKLYESGGKHSLKSQLLYSYRTIYHPFDGFWEIKTQQRGTVRSANVILAIVLLTFCYKEVATGYLFRTVAVEQINIPMVLLTVLLPLVLWCAASWGLTTLFDGKGKMKDIYVMTCYSMVPLIFTNIITTLMSNCMVLAEQDFITFITYVGYVWMAALIFSGCMTIHDYQFGKNTLMITFSIVGMGVMLFLALLFATVGQKLIEFFAALYEEAVLRM